VLETREAPASANVQEERAHHLHIDAAGHFPAQQERPLF